MLRIDEFISPGRFFDSSPISEDSNVLGFDGPDSLATALEQLMEVELPFDPFEHKGFFDMCEHLIHGLACETALVVRLAGKQSCIAMRPKLFS